MNKILIELFIPMLDQRLELFIPINKTFYQTSILIQKAIMEMTNGAYKISDKAIFYNQTTGKSYDINEIVKNSDLQNGSSLLLI